MKTFYKRLLSLGIALGVFCSLFVFTAGQRQWSAMRLSNKLLDSDTYKIVKSYRPRSISSMGLDEAGKIRDMLPEGCLSDLTVPCYQAEISYAGEPLLGSVTGAGCNLGKLLDLKIPEGRFLSEADTEGYRKVCVIKSSFYDLIKADNPDYLNINGEAYEIVGIIDGDISTGRMQTDGDVIIPFTSAFRYILKSNELSCWIYQIVFDRGGYTKAQLLEAMEEKAVTNGYDMSALKLMPYKYNEFQNDQEFIRSFLVLLLISFLVLLIAACNIIHIAAASVLDREREIGLKTALGAPSRHIIRQIAAEILICSFQGGLAGIAAASLLNTIINLHAGRLLLSFNIATIAAGILLAAAAGLITAIIPARKAAGLDPCAALREE